MTTDQTDDLSYTNLSRKLTAQQLAGIRDALCPGYEAPPVSPTLCRSVEKQIASIRRLSEVQPSPGARRGALLAAAPGGSPASSPEAKPALPARASADRS